MSAVPFADEVSATRFLMRPLNIWSRSDEEIGRLMSHFAHTPFELDGVRFGSVEAFYTWLLVGDEAAKADIALLSGPRAKYECPMIKPEHFNYRGRTIRLGSSEHMELIKRANRAKLETHPAIAHAFVATLPRPIVHILPGKEHDPHEAFCAIMTEIRDEFAARFAAKVR
jgi:predicted NAD-dependent protein-ADP-ribosyltransferase YbiA (DUF1768 family)